MRATVDQNDYALGFGKPPAAISDLGEEVHRPPDVLTTGNYFTSLRTRAASRSETFVPLPRRRKTAAQRRVQVRGKFLFDGAEKLYVRGVTYGTFHPNEQG